MRKIHGFYFSLNFASEQFKYPLGSKGDLTPHPMPGSLNLK